MRSGYCVGLPLCELDHFKAVNDDFGHDTGNVVLRDASTPLSDTVLADDGVIREGSEEVLIVAAADRISGLQHLAERLPGAVDRAG